MKNFLWVSVLFLICLTTLNAQQKGSITIIGKVVDEETGAPLENTNIFLTNTTIGTTSDKYGKFIIKNVPYGSYNIIFSYIGYETEGRNFYLYNSKTIEFNISLKPKTLGLHQVNVTGIAPKDWGKDLKIFTRLFLGKTDNSKKTKILNPEVLNFIKGKSDVILKAYADSVIKVENDALGYMIYIVLDSLVYNNSGIVKYKFYPKFKELTPSSVEEKSTWDNNRKETYLNSRRYFFYSLIHNQLNKVYYPLREFMGRPSLENYGRIIYPQELNLTSNKDSTIYTINFQGSIEVKRYVDEPSYLIFYYPSVTIDKFGNLLTSYSIEDEGYWATQRVADLLPQNYFYNGH